MRNIFIGLLFVFLNFNINMGNSSIGLIPTFIGYIYIGKGLIELAEQSEWFTRLKTYAAGMAIYSGIIYVMDLIGISKAMGTMSAMLLGLVSTVFSLYISYGIIMGVKDIEAANQWELNSISLFSTWKVLALCSILGYLLLIIPMVGFISIILGIIVSICFLYSFSKTKNMYYNQT